MSEAPVSPIVKRGGKPPPPEPVRVGPSRPIAWQTESSQPIEIVAPDRKSTELLLEQAIPLFPAQIVPGSAWIVRLQPPTGGGGWVIELLSLVEQWLEAARLPCANVLYGGRRYLIRASTEGSRFAGAEPGSEAAGGASA